VSLAHKLAPRIAADILAPPARKDKFRRGIGGFTDLCGAVSSNGAYHVDLGIKL
jgi:hypothetical protein